MLLDMGEFWDLYRLILSVLAGADFAVDVYDSFLERPMDRVTLPLKNGS